MNAKNLLCKLLQLEFKTQLPEYLHAIFFSPMLHDLSVCDAHNVDCSEIDPPACRWNTPEVTGMRTRHRYARHHLIAFGNEVLNRGEIIRHPKQRRLMYGDSTF